VHFVFLVEFYLIVIQTLLFSRFSAALSASTFLFDYFSSWLSANFAPPLATAFTPFPAIFKASWVFELD